MDKLINKAKLERMIIALNERYEELVNNEKARAQSKEEEIATRAEEAINMLGGKSIVYISKEEYDNLDETAKNDDTVTYFITDAENDLQSREDGNLITEDKTIVGAINEVHDMFGGKSIVYISKEEYNNLDETAKNDDTVTYFITDAENDLQSREDGNLITEDKTIVGAINEIHNMLGGKSIVYISKEEYDDLDETAKNDDTVTYFITDEEDDFQSREDGNLTTEDKTIVGAINELDEALFNVAAKAIELDNYKADKSDLEIIDAITLNGYSLWVGTTSDLEAIETKDPNTIYFEIDDDSEASEDVVQVDVIDGMLHLTTDKYQITEMIEGTEIVLPEVDRFTEIHLYFNSVSLNSIVLPECKWRVESNVEEAN